MKRLFFLSSALLFPSLVFGVSLEIDASNAGALAASLGNAVQSNAVISAIIWGGLSLVVYFFPLFYYMIAFYGQGRQSLQDKSFFEIITTALVLQIFIVLIGVAAGIFSNNLLSGNNDGYSAARGMRVFYLADGISSTKTTKTITLNKAEVMWNKWNPGENIEELSTLGGEKQLATGAIIGIFYISIALFILLIALPIAASVYPFFYIMRHDQQDILNNGEEGTVTQKLAYAFLMMIGIFVVLSVHEMLGTAFVETLGKMDGFSMKRMMQIAITEVIVGQ